MNRRSTTLAIVVAAALVLSACGDDDDAAGPLGTGATVEAGDPAGTSTPGETDAPDTRQDTAASLQLVSTPLGDVLADDEGWIVYLFTPDEQGESTCYDACEANWPVVDELASVGDGLDPELLGTTTRTDGTVQATYNGWPLYTFAGDPSPGTTNGQGLNGIWWVVDAAGDAVET